MNPRKENSDMGACGTLEGPGHVMHVILVFNWFTVSPKASSRVVMSTRAFRHSSSWVNATMKSSA